jgi:hypothetical protein
MWQGQGPGAGAVIHPSPGEHVLGFCAPAPWRVVLAGLVAFKDRREDLAAAGWWLLAVAAGRVHSRPAPCGNQFLAAATASGSGGAVEPSPCRWMLGQTPRAAPKMRRNAGRFV